MNRNYIVCLNTYIQLHLSQCRRLSCWAAGGPLPCSSQLKAKVSLVFPRSVQFLQDNFWLTGLNFSDATPASGCVWCVRVTLDTSLAQHCSSKFGFYTDFEWTRALCSCKYWLRLSLFTLTLLNSYQLPDSVSLALQYLLVIFSLGPIVQDNVAV